MFKVLLVAPTDPKKPSKLKLLVGGENTFTKSLLANPPKGVSYTYYLDALANGEIEYTFLHRALKILTKLRIMPIGAGSECFHLRTDFDLVHCHAYGIKIDRNIPIILSDSSSNYLFLRDYVNWPMWRIKLTLVLKKLLLKSFGVLDPDVNIGDSKLIVFSKFAFNIHKLLGTSAHKMKIFYPGLKRIGKVKTRGKKVVNILFVGTWFERKGGLILMEAYKKLSPKHKNVRLTIVSEVGERLEGVKQYDFVPSGKLMKDFFPSADIFVLVPPKVEGFGFSVVEAMSFGIPMIVSNVCALPELVEDGKTGFVVRPGNVDDLVEKMEALIQNPALRKKMGDAARKRFEENFSIEKSNKELLKIYMAALKSS